MSSRGAHWRSAGLNLLMSGTRSDLYVNLGPNLHSAIRQSLSSGQAIQVNGVVHSIGGHNYLLARQLVIGNRTIDIRNANGALIHTPSPGTSSLRQDPKRAHRRCAMRLRQSILRATLTAFAITLTGCGGGSSSTPPPANPDHRHLERAARISHHQRNRIHHGHRQQRCRRHLDRHLRHFPLRLLQFRLHRQRSRHGLHRSLRPPTSVTITATTSSGTAASASATISITAPAITVAFSPTAAHFARHWHNQPLYTPSSATTQTKASPGPSLAAAPEPAVPSAPPPPPAEQPPSTPRPPPFPRPATRHRHRNVSHRHHQVRLRHHHHHHSGSDYRGTQSRTTNVARRRRNYRPYRCRQQRLQERRRHLDSHLRHRPGVMRFLQFRLNRQRNRHRLHSAHNSSKSKHSHRHRDIRHRHHQVRISHHHDHPRPRRRQLRLPLLRIGQHRSILLRWRLHRRRRRHHRGRAGLLLMRSERLHHHPLGAGQLQSLQSQAIIFRLFSRLPRHTAIGVNGIEPFAALLSPAPASSSPSLTPSLPPPAPSTFRQLR